jgi:uncharacterized membrane protein
MKKLKYILSSLFIFIPVLVAKAQLVDSSVLSGQAAEVGSTAGFTGIGIGKIVATVISAVLGLLALLFLVLTIMAGFKWMTAGGNDEEVKKAVTSLKNAAIGLVVVLAAYAITYFIFNKLPFAGGGSLMPAATGA